MNKEFSGLTSNSQKLHKRRKGGKTDIESSIKTSVTPSSSEKGTDTVTLQNDQQN